MSYPAPGAGDDSAPDEITRWLQAASAGDPVAFDALYARVYDDLHRLAHRVRAGRAGETLSTSALVHEAYLKLVPAADHAWDGRSHFFGIAARAMRQILVEAARRRGTVKRGGEPAFVTLGDATVAQPVRADELLALDEALQQLRTLDARRAHVVEYRFFAGLSVGETAELLGVSVPTVERDWRAARAWLTQALADHAGPDSAARDPGAAR